MDLKYFRISRWFQVCSGINIKLLKMFSWDSPSKNHGDTTALKSGKKEKRKKKLIWGPDWLGISTGYIKGQLQHTEYMLLDQFIPVDYWLKKANFERNLGSALTYEHRTWAYFRMRSSLFLISVHWILSVVILSIPPFQRTQNMKERV